MVGSAAIATLAARTKLPHDAVAYVASATLMVATVESVKIFTRAGLASNYMTRKLMHMVSPISRIACSPLAYSMQNAAFFLPPPPQAAGPIFMLTWPFFSSKKSSWIAACVPLAMTLKFALVGLGVWKSDIDVQTMSRTGSREELLRGPLLYGVVFVLVTGFFFRDIIAASALLALCFGDGMSDVFGRRYGGTHKLPWSPRKSWAGSGAFIISAFVACVLCASAFQQAGWLLTPLDRMVLPLFAATLAGAAVESLPYADVDNILVPGAVAAVLAATAEGH
jgi:hypothetical protein